jgi:CRP-like cAMP-binding protein
MKKIKIEDLDKIVILKGTKEETKKNFYDKCIIKNVSKKQILFREKEEINKVYILLRGKATIFKTGENGEKKIVYILNSGEALNEILIEIKTSVVGCEVFEDAIILECFIKDILEIMESDFIFTKNIIGYMEKRIRRLYRQLKNTASIKIEKRLAAKLWKISKDFGVKSGEWTVINLSLSITYLSDMLGCPRETISRAMKILEKEELIKMENKTIYVKKHELSNYFKGI